MDAAHWHVMERHVRGAGEAARMKHQEALTTGTAAHAAVERVAEGWRESALVDVEMVKIAPGYMLVVEVSRCAHVAVEATSCYDDRCLVGVVS